MKSTSWAARIGGVSLAVAFVVMAALVFSTPVSAVQDEDMGYFRARVSPHVAGVFIEGKYYGNVSMFATRDRAIPLKAGVYNVELRDPRYKPLRAKVTIEAGMTSTLRRVMEPLTYDTKGPFGELRTEDFGNAAIYLNGKYYANSTELQPPFGRSLLVKPGNYHLKIEPADGSIGREADIEIRADMTLIVGREKIGSYEE